MTHISERTGRQGRRSAVAPAVVVVASLAAAASVASGFHHGASAPPARFFGVVGRRPAAPTALCASVEQERDTSMGSDDDEALLSSVDASYLADLCAQCDLPTTGTKDQLLARLREYAAEQAREDAERRRLQTERKREEIETGFDAEGEPTKHKLAEVGIAGNLYGMGRQDEEGGDDDDDAFYFRLPSDRNTTTARNNADSADGNDDAEAAFLEEESTWENPVTVPPPPPDDIPVNEDGERVVTVYSTSDRNDLTAMGAESMLNDPGQEGMAGGYARAGAAGTDANLEDGLVGGPFGDASQSRGSRGKQAERETEEAEGIVRQLVGELLATTGLPAFRDEMMGDDENDEEESDGAADGYDQPYASSSTASDPLGQRIKGFDPTSVPAPLLSSPATARALRHDRGSALAATIRDFELRAIGYDGTFGDDTSKGGGHYREVRKVGAFLEGYRRAEVRRSARGTAAMLLDRLVSEGVEGLDLTLATMSRGGGNAGASEWGADGEMGAGELNDALLEYLDEAIRGQERKVERVVGSGASTANAVTEKSRRRQEEDDDVAPTWEADTDGSGDILEVLDPNDPEVRKAVQMEIAEKNFDRDDGAAPSAAQRRAEAVETAPEKLLLLLTCLRDRVGAEAAFGTDERGRNLRVLARVLHAPGGDGEREAVMLKELGSSLDRLDSFLELLADALEYAETNAQRVLQPGAGQGQRPVPSLDVALLERVKSMAEDARDTQAWKASGVSLSDDGNGGDLMGDVLGGKGGISGSGGDNNDMPLD